MSTVSPLLSVPRKTTGDVDYAPAIRQIITQTYGESAERYSEEIASLNRARQDAVRGSAGSDATARDLLYRYFGQLELLELRFPDIRVPFPWNDAFAPSKSISQLSLAYEKASVIFNIAATLSALAAAQNRSSPEGLKRSFNFYRQAAGMFTYINDNFLHAPSTDLGRDLVKVLITLMTGQATEVFLERMNEEKRSPGLKSKICAQGAAVYAGVQEEVKEQVGKGIFDRSWLVLVQVKAKFFASLAQYNKSLADTTSSKHGDALGRLNLAENIAKEARQLSYTYAPSYYGSSTASQTLPADAGNMLQELCNNHLTLVTEARTAAIKDNDLVYHALVPSEAALPQIEKSANVAEPIPIQEIYASPDVQKLVGQDIFIKLVPLSVIESSSMYSEEKAKILRTEGERCDIADGELTAGLDHLSLPASLAKFRSGAEQDTSIMADPGSQVLSWASEIQSSEADKRVESSIGELSQLRDRASADLEWASNALDSEQRECEQARVRFDYHFEQSPSGSHTRNWRNDIKNDREALTQARASDDQVLSLWGSVREDVGLLAAGRDIVEGVFADAIARASQGEGSSGQNLLDFDLPNDQGQELAPRISSIQESLSKLQKLKKERVDVLADLKERIHNDDISQLLILNRKSQNVEPTLFAAELEKFRPHQARLQATIQAQEHTMASINAEYTKLISGKKGKEIQNKYAKSERVKKDLTARFKRAYEAYRESRSGVTKGIAFYQELSGLLTTLRQEVSQFVSSRASERSSMTSSAEMKQRLAGGGQKGSSVSAYSGEGLDKAFDSMSFSSSARSPTTPISPTRPPGQSASSAYSGYSGQQASYASPPPRPPSTYSSYSNTSSAYPPASNPSLPPKPSPQGSYGGRPSGSYRQASGSGLPPPPSQPQYSQYSSQGPSIPPPPSAMSYSSTSSYNTAPPAPSSYPSPAPSNHSYGAPPPPSSYSSPPPALSHQYNSHPSYQQQPGVPPRPQAQAQGSYSSYSSQPSYGQPSQPSYGQPSQPAYGQPASQQYGQHQPYRQDSGYGQHVPPPPQHPAHQYQQQPSYSSQQQPSQYQRQY